MTTPQMPGQQQIVTPPIHKTHLTCCSYVCSQGIPKPWQCPGCGKWQNLDAPPPQ
jgi:hypothetical protein